MDTPLPPTKKAEDEPIALDVATKLEEGKRELLDAFGLWIQNLEFLGVTYPGPRVWTLPIKSLDPEP